MKRLFFAFILALMALGFTACSDSDSDGGEGIPAAESAFQFPGNIPGVPATFDATSSRYLRYEVTADYYNEVYKKLDVKPGWACTTTAPGTDYYSAGRSCTYPALFDISYEADFEAMDNKSKLYIELTIANDLASPTLPSVENFIHFGVSGREVGNGYTVTYTFNDIESLSYFENDYIYDLVAGGFKLDDDSSASSADKVYKRKLQDNVTAFGVRLQPDYTAFTYDISAGVSRD
jgi:hypothetical protein